MRRLTGVAVLFLASLVRADDAGAERLFDDGRALMKAGRYPAACEKFLASEHLSPAGGTELNLADCYVKIGRTASAWALYRQAAGRAAAAHVVGAEAAALEHATRLEPLLSTLAVEVVAPASDLEVLRDGEKVPREAWGTAVPVDPGPHAVEARRPGFVAFSWKGSVDGGAAHARVQVPELERAAVTPVPVSSDGSVLRTGAWFVGGAGVVALGLGAAFGLHAMSQNDAASALCPNASRCADRAALDRADEARTFATVSTVSFVAAGALVATGVVLFLVSPRVVVAPTVGGVWIGGAF